MINFNDNQALNEIIEIIFYEGQYPKLGRAKFSLYEFLLENRDPSFCLEMYIATLSDDDEYLNKRRMYERKVVTELLKKHLQGSEMVIELAEKIAKDNE